MIIRHDAESFKKNLHCEVAKDKEWDLHLGEKKSPVLPLGLLMSSTTEAERKTEIIGLRSLYMPTLPSISLTLSSVHPEYLAQPPL